MLVGHQKLVGLMMLRVGKYVSLIRLRNFPNVFLFFFNSVANI